MNKISALKSSKSKIVITNNENNDKENQISNLKRRPGRPRKVPKAGIIEIDNLPLYCYCKKEDEGRIKIGCDGDNCSIGWFHADCLGLESVPKGAWYCVKCAQL